jgi:hypothetical protein
MKGTILAIWIGTSLFLSGTAIGQPWTTQSTAPVQTPGLAGQVATVTFDRLVTPRSKLTGRRSCVGFPSCAPASFTRPGAPLSLVTAGRPHWA